MNNRFIDGLTKLWAGNKEHQPAPPPKPPYQGNLSSKDFQLSKYTTLGLDSIVPHTLAYEPLAQVVAICTEEGHVRLFGPELDLCLENPQAPVLVQFLVFPRSGLLLLLSIAAGEGANTGGWVAQWWDLRQSALRASGGLQPPQFAFLRFGVTSVTCADEAGAMAFLGTDEGDVRLFDAGERPHMGAYCISASRLSRGPQQRGSSGSGARSAGPITALACFCPGREVRASPELLVATAEGALALWSFERHRSSRFFEAPWSSGSGTAVCSLLWHSTGNEFLAASRGEVRVFTKSTGACTACVPLPGGSTSSVTLLMWDATIGQAAGSAEAGPSSILLRRGAPAAGVFSLRGAGWSEVQSLLPEERTSTLASAIVCMPRFGSSTGVEPGKSGVPCGCMTSPSLSQGLGCEPTGQSLAHLRLAGVPLLLLAVGEPYSRLLVSTLPPLEPLLWPASWGSMELAGTTAVQLVQKPSSSLLPDTHRASPPCHAAEDCGNPDRCQGSAQSHSQGQGGQTAGVLCGQLVRSCAVPLPTETSELETLDGWLICSQGDDAEDGNETGEGVLCTLSTAETGTELTVTCEVSFGLDAKGLLVLCSLQGETKVLFDTEEQRVCIESSSPEGPSARVEVPLNIEPGAEHQLVVRSNAAGLSVLLGGDVVAQHPNASAGVLQFRSLSWRCLSGELRLRNVSWETPCIESQEKVQTEACPSTPNTDKEAQETGGTPRRVPPLGRLVEVLLSQRLAHFDAFVGHRTEPAAEALDFVDSWCAMVGGWQGLLCTGHQDGTVRLWLRGHASVLLVHTLSVLTLDALPWRPRYGAGVLFPGGEAGSSAGQWCTYDSVDACPAVAVLGDEIAGNHSAQVTAVVFEPSLGAIAAATNSGLIVLFLWSGEPQQMSALEFAELCVQGLVAPSGPGQHDASAEEKVEGDSAYQEASCSADTASPEVTTNQLNDSGSPPRLRAGFACTARHRSHQAPVHLLQLVPLGDGSLHVVSADAASWLCVLDAFSGEVLFAEAMDSRMAGVATLGCPSGPPPDTVEGLVLSAGILHVPVAPPPGAQPPGDHSALVSKVDSPSTYVLALSSGGMRQLLLPSMRLADNRIQEAKLPQLPGGSVLSMHLEDTFLLVVQSAGAHAFERTPAMELVPSAIVNFAEGALGAGVFEVAGEQCLLVLLTGFTLQIRALPTLHLLASLSGANASTSCGQQSCAVASDGYFTLRLTRGAGLVLGSGLAAACTLDGGAQSVAAAQLAQALGSGPPGDSSSSASSSAPARPAGFFGAAASLFGTSDQARSLRQLAAPASSALPGEVDAAQLDRQRGLPPAVRELRESRAPQPPALWQSGAETRAARSAASAASTGAELQEANRKAQERGEKLSELGEKTQKMADDAANFMDLAKQLNARQQNRWF